MFRQSCFLAYALLRSPAVANQPMIAFAAESTEAKNILNACKKLRGTSIDCPIMINGQEYRTNNIIKCSPPSDHALTIGTSYNASEQLAEKAIECALKSAKEWRNTPFRERAAIFLKAAHLLTTQFADEMRAATMLGQSKTAWQAEIDCIAEAADFLRFNVHFAEELYAQQPISTSPMGIWNMTDYRPLEGFFTAITPFNFTAIAANLAGTPALMGNVVIWKPSPNAILSNYLMYKVFEAAGLPPGVINFLPCEPSVMEKVVTCNKDLAGVAFTGSTRVFTEINKKIYSRLEEYSNFPRVTGETGGKDFHIIHPSADLPSAAALTMRAAFEYQGQKCSACSRLYIARSVWSEFKKLLLDNYKEIKVGQPDDRSSFMCAVIDATAFAKCKKYIDIAKEKSDCYEIIVGGECDKTRGYFVQPTIITSKDPHAQLMKEEIFGPILTVYVYDDAKPEFWKEVCNLVDSSTQYGLTGAVFARDRAAISDADKYLRYACGNYYVNDKCTGAVVGQQPFGGARKSGTNDKPGSALFLTRFVSARAIKENFAPSSSLSYPHEKSSNITERLK